MSERRRHARHPIQVPVNVCTDRRRDRAGMIRDLSVDGLLFHSRSKYAIGDEVELMFLLDAQRPQLRGRVVRTFIDDNVDNVFPHVTAVTFEAPLFDLP
jgi:hypothetical protein